jgi:hypothetical protein
MNQLRKFMYGRYGFDQYTRAIILTGLAITLIASLTRNSLIILLSYIPIIYAFFRILSKNIQKRSKENYIYCDIIRKVKVNFNNFKLLAIGTKTHKYYKCRNCRQMIRIPRGKGKISISCPKCKKEFVSRT